MTQNSVLKLPQNSKIKQIQNKIAWNKEHYCVEADFYTIGYSGLNIQDFIIRIQQAKIKTIIDIRFTPLSRFKPEFSKNNLKRILETNGVQYIHKPEWGVPKSIRLSCAGKENRNDIWTWYDAHVLPALLIEMENFFNETTAQPIAFLCSEYDPTECHRHRVFLGLKRLGWQGQDI